MASFPHALRAMTTPLNVPYIAATTHCCATRGAVFALRGVANIMACHVTPLNALAGTGETVTVSAQQRNATIA